ncbi:MAG: hypothetical protein ACXW6J_05985 [Candidatus Binatia bacterium]
MHTLFVDREGEPEMKTPGIRMSVLLILQTLWLGTSHGADVSNPKIEEELLKQQGIYQSEGESKPEGYVINRGLLAYTEALSPGFDRALANLGPKDRWLDIGAGEGQAILDYYNRSQAVGDGKSRERRGTKARAVAISIEDRRQPSWYQTAASLATNQIQYFSNKRMRDFSLDELGKFQVITDLLGGFSYTDQLSSFTEKVLQLLDLKGSFYTLLQDVKSEGGTNQPFYANSPYLTEIANADGSEVKVCSWLKSITCVEVTCQLRTDWKPPVEIYHVHKVCSGVTVPALARIKYGAGTPPERRFLLKK